VSETNITGALASKPIREDNETVKLENEFVVNVPIERAWEVLTDIPEIAPCLPGARLTGQDGDVYSGKVKIKVGPVTAEYAGTADFLNLDNENYHVDIDAKGRDSRGSGNASAVITADMSPVDGGTKVVIHTDLKIAGKVAQFGKGVIGDVSKKLIDQFVECIHDKLEHDGEEPEEAIEQVAAASAEEGAEQAGVAAAAPEKTAAAEPVKRTFEQPEQEMEALDLMDAAGGAVFKRAAPAIAAAAIIALIIWVINRR
jgi:carbon monoxide dehydrogenase subunit G